MLAVLLSADMILMSHAPSNLPNLLPAKPAASPQPVEKPAAEREGGKDENGFLRSDLRGEIRDNKVECLGCNTNHDHNHSFLFFLIPLFDRNGQRIGVHSPEECKRYIHIFVEECY